MRGREGRREERREVERGRKEGGSRIFRTTCICGLDYRSLYMPMPSTWK